METDYINFKNGLLKKIPGERFTPYTLAEKLSAKVLLESASLERGKDRYSLLLVEEAAKIIQQGDDIFLDKKGKRFRLKTGKDILDVLLYFANQHSGVEHEFPLPAGGVGYLAYEYCARFDKIRLAKKPDELEMPDAVFILGHVFLIFDHYTDTITIAGLNYKEAEIDLKKAISKIEKRINDLDFNFMKTNTEKYDAVVLDSPEEETIYMQGVEKVREEVIRGNLLQGVLSRRVHIKTDMPALHGYRNLRSFNPSPYMFYLNCGEFELFGSSPEVHVKVKGERAILRPIAGTRKRGKTQAEEKALEKELLSDEKERAEHLMLVDLARNDLGRICRPGTVQPTEMMVIEKYSHVMHIVSEVEGKLKEGKTGLDALRATFPAGTVSGAPKIKAIEVIDGLEKHSRRFYAGVVGYVEPDGNLDTCIVIRSAMKKGDLLIFQAGAGIVYDSLPHKEYEETSSKLGALGKAVGVELGTDKQ